MTYDRRSEVIFRLTDQFSCRKSWPDGCRWTVVDGSGFDDDVFAMYDTEAEARAAVHALNRLREDVLPLLKGDSE